MERLPVERILCPVDFSEFSLRAYEYASSLARHYHARLFVQHVVELWRHPSACFAAAADQYTQFCRDLRTSGEAQLAAFLKGHSSEGLRTEALVDEGLATECILQFARAKAVNLIVMGTHGCHGFDRLMLGSVTEAVLRKARCSVLAVHRSLPNWADDSSRQGEIALREIVFCTDFSRDADEALPYALSVAAEYDANLTLVHVLDGMARVHAAEHTAKARTSLEGLIAAHSGKALRVETAVLSGRAYREISHFAADKKADLVIMAVHGRGHLDDAVFGSTTYRVVQVGSCPVLAVHP
jgi:nucleotide-binding universal stress UspA family protein